ncbi:MAG: Aspartate aminotransferase [Chlamydiae bacterium]|nr:Aspartate aminotransferase [Chlamydiota bacterium]
MGIFEKIPELPVDPILGITAAFKADPHPGKCSFIIGFYRDEHLKTPILETVAEVEKRIAEARLKREYLPIDGDPEFVNAIEELVFGKTEDRICGVQTIGGTGALALSGQLATKWTDQIAISNLTWANHWKIYQMAGLKTEPYPYYEERHLCFEKMIENLSSLPEKSCVLVHTNCHNPTGLDLSHDEWQTLLEVTEKKNLFPILDMAYQGFSAAPEQDAYGPRLFLEKGVEFALTYTCAKNFSLYGERAGALFVVGESKKKMEAVRSQIKSMIRGTYSNPPIHPAAVVKGILRDATLHEKWLTELSVMRQRMHAIREAFIDRMIKKDPEGNWEPIRSGKGLFCNTELSTKAIEKLRKEKGIYFAADGRINLTGINQENIEVITDAIVAAK